MSDPTEWEDRSFETGRIERARTLQADLISTDPTTYRVTGTLDSHYHVTRLKNPRTGRPYWFCTCDDVEHQKRHYCKHEIRARLKDGDPEAIEAYLVHERRRRPNPLLLDPTQKTDAT